MPYVGWVCWLSTLLREVFPPGTPVFPSPQKPTFAGVAQLASVRLSEQGVPSSILGDFNLCFHFRLISVAIALNIVKGALTEGGGKVHRRLPLIPVS